MKEKFASKTFIVATILILSAAALTGCSVARHQQSVGSYVDDAGITTAIKAKFSKDTSVAATSISVETLKGVVQLSGFSRDKKEKNRAEEIARETKGVVSVKNDIIIRP